MEKKKRKPKIATKDIKRVTPSKHKKFSTKKADNEWEHIFWIGMGAVFLIILLFENL